MVLSLLYLSRQIRISNRIARADAYRFTKTRTSVLVDDWGSDPEWAELFIRIRYQQVSRKDLTPRERAVAGLRLQALVLNFEAIHHDVREGILPESAYDILGHDTFSIPYIHEIWPLLRNEYSEEFRSFFEGRFGLPATSESLNELPPGLALPERPGSSG